MGVNHSTRVDWNGKDEAEINDLWKKHMHKNAKLVHSRKRIGGALLEDLVVEFLTELTKLTFYESTISHSWFGDEATITAKHYSKGNIGAHFHASYSIKVYMPKNKITDFYGLISE